VAATFDELQRQLAAEPGVARVTWANSLPGMYHPNGRFEVEGDAAAAAFGYVVAEATVAPSFFHAMDAPVSGRGFTAADVAAGREVAVVNTPFVERVFRGRAAVGRRVRRVAREGEAAGPWIEIVGVVRDLGMGAGRTEGGGLYRPLGADAAPYYLALRVDGAPAALATRVRQVAGRVEPALRLYDVEPLDRAGAEAVESQYLSGLLTVLSALTLLLSLIAIYSVMAFTVRQRTKEIGTRVALGADRRQIVAAVVRRPLGQIAIGICAGVALVVFLFVGAFEAAPTPLQAGLIGAYALVMLAVCLSACVVPTRWALRLQPSQVLRPEA
jgi:hypothetical protein